MSNEYVTKQKLDLLGILFLYSFANWFKEQHTEWLVQKYILCFGSYCNINNNKIPINQENKDIAEIVSFLSSGQSWKYSKKFSKYESTRYSLTIAPFEIEKAHIPNVLSRLVFDLHEAFMKQMYCKIILAYPLDGTTFSVVSFPIHDSNILDNNFDSKKKYYFNEWLFSDFKEKLINHLTEQYRKELLKQIQDMI
jgi:hypothetical protein